MVKHGLLKDTPDDIAEWLFRCPDLEKERIGEYLGEPYGFFEFFFFEEGIGSPLASDKQCQEVLKCFTSRFDFRNLDFDIAIRYVPFFVHLRLRVRLLHSSYLYFVSVPD